MKYTAEQVQVAIKEWKVSGLSKKAFCQQKDICYQTFYNWLKRNNESGSHGFTEMSLPARVQSNSCEVIFPSGVRLLLQGEPSASWLRDLLR